MTRKKSPRRSIWAPSNPLDERPSPARLAAEEGDAPEPEPSKKTFADVDGIAREAAQYGEGLLGFLLWMDSRFVANGQHAISPWWRFSLAEFFESDKVWGLFMVGRSAGKSTTLVRVAILYVLFGCLFAKRMVPPGQRWIWPFISAHTNDAARRINEAQALLRALGLDTKPKGHAGSRTIEMIDVQSNDVAFLSLAATIAGVSGPSALGGTVDEEAKLRDRAQHVNPSTEIIASIAQMFRARPGVHAIRCSSAWYEEGSHYAAIKEGPTDATYVARLGGEFVEAAVKGLQDVASWEDARGNLEAAVAIRKQIANVSADSPQVPTWVANPTISAIALRAHVESTPVDASEGNTPRWRIWLRENASVAMPTGATTAGPTEEEYRALAEANARLTGQRREGGAFRDDGLIRIPGYGDDFKPVAKKTGRAL